MEPIIETAADTLKYGATWALTIMAAYLSIRPPQSLRLRVIWISAFVVVSAIGTWGTIVADVEDRNQLAATIVGRNNYAYVRVLNTQNEQDGNYLSLTTTGGFAHMYVGFYPLDSEGRRHDSKWLPPLTGLPKTTVNLPVALETGRYDIDFLSGDYRWVEHLEFSLRNGELDQVFWVERDDRSIYQEP